MIEAAPKPPPKKQPRQPKASNSFDPYKALGFQDKREKTDQTDIEATYKVLRRKWHPDRHMQASKEEQDKATQRMSEINQAYDIIGNPKRRAVYDRTGKTELWELDELVEREKKDSVALVRPGKGASGAGDKPKGLKNIFRKG
jgi:curved DNA-binding protein CbpA